MVSEVEAIVNGKKYRVTKTQVENAFEQTSENDWKDIPGQEPDRMIRINDQLKPIKAVFRKILDGNFTTNDAARILDKLGIDQVKNSALIASGGWASILNKFIMQSGTRDLKVSNYPNIWNGLRMKVSFGMGSPARIPWIAFTAPDMQVSNGFYPVYLYYKDFNTLILAYGISETEEFSTSWPIDIMSSKQTIESFFRKKVPRYGDSRVFTAYSLKMQNDRILIISQEGNQVSENEIELDLLKLLDYYKKIVSLPLSQVSSELSQGLFYMEKELENFLINNWDKTELGKKYDLIIEDGELKSQQYRTDIGPIDILVRDKRNKNYVVIELKKNQTSDDTIGQIARYMGWVKEKLHDENVHGIIIAGAYDERLFYASKTVPNVELFIYKVDFKLGDFSPELKFDNS